MNYPYVQATKRLQDFMQDIRKKDIPKVVDNDWFKEIGYDTRNDFRMAQVLEHISLIDKQGKPTKHWKDYKNSEAPAQVLAPLVRRAYTKFFDNFSEPQEMKNRELREYLKKYINAGKQVLYYTVRTFDVLSEMCDFTILPKDQQPGPEKIKKEAPKKDEPVLSIVVPEESREAVNGLNIRIVIQIGPETSIEAIDRIFDNIAHKLVK